jgi:hypothetical protein
VTAVDGQGIAPAGLAAGADRRIARKSKEIRFLCTGKTGQLIGRLDKK